MKNWYLIAAVIFIVGEVILFVDSRNMDCEVTLRGVLTDIQPDSVTGGARVEINKRISAVKSLSYENRLWRKVKRNDTVSLVITENSQSVYYGYVEEFDVRNIVFLWCGLQWLLLSLVMGILLKYLNFFS